MWSYLRVLGTVALLVGVVSGCGSSNSGGSSSIALVGFGGGASGGAGGSGPVVKIGWAGPLSGDQAYFGRSWLNGVKMAAQDFRFTGFLKGATVQVIVLDDAADPARGASVARQLVSDGVAGVVANFNSGVTLASEPIYHRANVPQVTVSSNPSITARGYRNVIQLNENDNFQGGQMAVFGRQKLHITSVAVFNDSQAFGQGVSNGFVAGARSRGITVVGSNTALNPTSQDYTAALAPLLAKHPQAIYFGGTVTPGSLLCRQARAAGFTGPFLGSDGLYHPAFITGCGPKIGAAYLTTSVPPYDSSPVLTSFAAAYKNRFGVAPGPYSAYGHDEAGYLLSAINAAGRASGPAAVNQLHSITYQGVLGAERINAAGQLLNAPNYVYRVTGNGFTPVFSNRGPQRR